MKQTISSLLRQVCRNKSVVIVGPASSLEGHGKGYLVDKHDVVCRIDCTIPIPEYARPDYGSRTDVVMTNLWNWQPGFGIDEEAICQSWIDSGASLVRYSWSASNRTQKLNVAMRGRISVSEMEAREFASVCATLSPRYPTRGFAAICDLLGSGCSTLTIMGFTFQHLYGYAKHVVDNELHADHKVFGQMSPKAIRELAKTGNHSPDSELAVLRKIVSQTKQIKCDPFLSAAMGIGYTNVTPFAEGTATAATDGGRGWFN